MTNIQSSTKKIFGEPENSLKDIFVKHVFFWETLLFLKMFLNLILQGIDESKPECDENGYYEPLQCTFAGICRLLWTPTVHPS